ncbi:hypothetical protein LEMLEM_LOCUS11035, partial [Lemmus lemmus]
GESQSHRASEPLGSPGAALFLGSSGWKGLGLLPQDLFGPFSALPSLTHLPFCSVSCSLALQLLPLKLALFLDPWPKRKLSRFAWRLRVLGLFLFSAGRVAVCYRGVPGQACLSLASFLNTASSSSDLRTQAQAGPLEHLPGRKCSTRSRSFSLTKIYLSSRAGKPWLSPEGVLRPAFCGCYCCGEVMVAVRPSVQAVKVCNTTWSSFWTPLPVWARRTLRRSASGWPTW